MKRIISYLLALTMLSGFSFLAFATDYETSIDGRVDESIMENTACEQYSNLQSAFSGLYGDAYPAFYAGAYIDDAHNLVVKTTSDVTDEEISLIKLCAKSEDIIIDVGAEYSLNELLVLQDRIADYYCTNYTTSDVASAINSISVVNEENTIKIGVQNLTPTFEATLLSEIAQEMNARQHSVLPISLIEERVSLSPVSTTPMVESNNTSEDAMPTASIEVNPSENIIVDRKDGYAGYVLIGFPASRVTSSGTEYGFVTAAHFLEGTADWKEDGECFYPCYDSNIQRIGTMVYTKFSGTVDAGFVKCSNTSSCGHSIYTGTTLYEIQGYGSVPEKTTVAAMNQNGKEALEKYYNYTTYCLDTAAGAKEVVEKFGFERTMGVLASTIRHFNYDGRISRNNKDWARTIPSLGADGEVIISSSPALERAEKTLAELRKTQAAEHAPPQKPSIREQLAAAKAAQAEKPNTQRHQQNKGAR